MGGAAWQHFRALSYKNSLLKWRRPFTSCAELILPVIFIGLLVSIKESLEPEDVPALFSDEGTFRSGPYKYPSPDVQTLTDLYAFYGPVPDGAIGEEEDFCGFLSSNFVGGLPEQYEGLLFRCDDGDDGCSCQRKQIAIAPGNADDAALNTIVDDFIAAQPSTHTIDSTMSMMRRFEDEKAAIDYVRQSDYSDDPEITPLGAIIVVNGAAPDYDFVIRTNMTNGDFERILPPTEWSTSALVRSRDSDTGLAGTYLETYLENGFLLLQNTVFEFALAQEADEAGSTKPKVARTYTEFPSDDYTQDDFWSNIGAAGNLFGVFLAVALVYPFATVVRMLVSEKEAKIREGMKMMALSDTAFWSSWMILFFVINFIQTILIYVVGASLFEYSDGGLIFALFLFFLMASTALAFALAACFSRSMTAAILSSVFYITGYALYEGVWMNTVSTGAKLAACLHPVTCFTLATVPLAEYEEGGVGITSDTINSSEQNNFTFGDALGMLIADIFIWYGPPKTNDKR
uniref:ABC-2 type transporter transmembrane domain-containing protein n=3 Tax=Phaeomonas parva TaxID=124430 RepID=A0A7S1TV09_9STRA|mmetsp:Transcript_17025/g.52284  ORF Transcript_17025/g.52284 Transcript_17025/m.52284 type:complete len:516 (+) Transcript_17025:242-1789(+)